VGALLDTVVRVPVSLPAGMVLLSSSVDGDGGVDDDGDGDSDGDGGNTTAVIVLQPGDGVLRDDGTQDFQVTPL
jgi:hypothetical protein